jgi:hypothetical protein
MKINPITIREETSFPPKADLPSAEYFCLLNLILKFSAFPPEADPPSAELSYFLILEIELFSGQNRQFGTF